jgi:cytochrome P450 family 135
VSAPPVAAGRVSRWHDVSPPEYPPPPTDLSGLPPGPRTQRHVLGLRWLLGEHALLERCRERYGELFTLRMWPIGVLVVVGEPVSVRELFTADGEGVRAGEANAVMQTVAGPESLLLLDGSKHLQRRRLMLAPFHGERMTLYADLIEQEATREIDAWPLAESFSAHAAMQRVTLRVILRAVLGAEPGGPGGELRALLPRLLNSPALIWPPLGRDFGPGSPWRRFARLRERVDEQLFALIAARRADPDLPAREDVLSMLVAARDEQGAGLSDVELRDQLVTLLLAGHETTASALAWMFERVLRLPALHAQLRMAAQENDERYLDAFVKEGLRIRPVVPMAVRMVRAPLQLSGYTVPEGTLLGASMLLAQSNPERYPQPGEFRPERFLEGAPDGYAWIPFGGGMRRCIGAAFAALEMRVILRRVFARCELRAPEARPERPRRRFVTYQPHRGAQAELVARR